jgi:hypothetical protein
MHQDLRRLDAALFRALAPLDASQTQAKPPDALDRWSIQQIADHLLLTYRETVSTIRERVDRARVTRSVPNFPQRLGQFFVCRLGYFPRGRVAPPSVAPSGPVSIRAGAELLDRLRAELVLLDRVTQEGEALFGNRRAASHQVLGSLSMQQWRRFHLAHGSHHCTQIHRIRREHGF